MFTVLRKNFGGRNHDRYFSDWEHAKKELLADVNKTIEGENCKLISCIDKMNHEKGFYSYLIDYWFFEYREKCSWSLIECVFEDNL